MAATPKPPAPALSKKVRFTFVLTPEVIERIRTAAFWTPGASMSGIVAEATEIYIRKLEKQRGAKFVDRTGQVRTGKPPQK